MTCDVFSIGSPIRIDSIVSDSIDLDAMDCTDVASIVTDSSDGASISFCVFTSVCIICDSIRFALRNRIAIMVMIIVAIISPEAHTTSANVSCGSPSIDTRGTEIEKGTKTTHLVCQTGFNSIYVIT